MIGQHPREVLEELKIPDYVWQSTNDVKLASEYSTNLRQMSSSNFGIIAQHGYELIKAIEY